MPALSDRERNLLLWCAEWFLGKFQKEIVAQVQAEFPSLEYLRELADLEERVKKLTTLLAGPGIEGLQVEVDDTWNPLLKRVLLAYRLEKATEVERLREKTAHLEVLDRLDETIRPLDELAARRWIREAAALPIPRLTDYLDLERVEKKVREQLRLARREFDEKFHILQAPSLFLPDLHYYREKCALRGAPVAVAFLDIDEFKRKFNTPHGETQVDRRVLPRFMRALEAHVAFHGQAYRQGGDEYMILLPGLSRGLAIAFLEELRGKLGRLDYPDVPERTTVSIGLCVAEADCPLTDRELRERANRAEAFAKRSGRNCIATYRGRHLADDELYIAAPAGRMEMDSLEPRETRRPVEMVPAAGRL
jgi:diguanylate cyclase (GGDEF)-like protein